MSTTDKIPDMAWDNESSDIVLLLAGRGIVELGYMMPSKSRKQWEGFVNLPGATLAKKWAPEAEMRAIIAAAVCAWFERVHEWRPRADNEDA